MNIPLDEKPQQKLPKILGIIQKIFPPVILPQKRYMLMGAIILYFGLKAFVAITPTTDDDSWPDQVKDFFLTVASLDSSDVSNKA